LHATCQRQAPNKPEFSVQKLRFRCKPGGAHRRLLERFVMVLLHLLVVARRLQPRTLHAPRTLESSVTASDEGQMATRHRRNQGPHLPTKKMISLTSKTFGAAVLAAALLGCGDMKPDTGGGSGASTGVGGTGSGAGGGGGVAFQCQGVGNGIGEMVSVAGGEFLMGCNQDVDNECRPDELPSRIVFVSDFQIDKTEVTQGMYAACVQANGCDPPSCEWDCGAANNPAGCVTRQQGMDYCAWAGKRLPSEAEWEKAARGADGRKFPWGNDAPNCDLVNMSGCGEVAKPVGSQPAGASPYGALDMGGNMVEMLADWYDPGYYQAMPDRDPKGPSNGATYVGRGGGWKSEAKWHRTAIRDWYDVTNQGRSLGFRCAR
jgi:hypothetical protein